MDRLAVAVTVGVWTASVIVANGTAIVLLAVAVTVGA
jgi:hypothetical protein